MHDPESCPITQEQLNVSKGIEIGHIFYFGDKYSKPMKASVTSQDGKMLTCIWVRMVLEFQGLLAQ